jgi:hypothetical protein
VTPVTGAVDRVQPVFAALRGACLTKSACSRLGQLKTLVFSLAMDSDSPSRLGGTAIFVAIVFAAFCAVAPWLRYGIPSGHDFEFHFNSWVEVLDHWKQGVLYPHWAAWAHYGYGEARFIFYPPISWTGGAVLGAVLPWSMVPAAFVWLALTLAGLSMYAAARNWLSRGSALFAAILYALNPYHLVIVYWRSAMAELLASIYLPLLFLCIIRLQQNGKRMIAPIAVLLAAGWLTNIPSSIMMHYSLAVLVGCIAISHKDWKVLAPACVAVIAGALIAAVYLLPVLHQRTWVTLDQVLSPGVRPQDNFLFSHTTDLDHDKFNLLVSVVAVCEFVLLGVTLLFWRAKARARQIAELWWPVLSWSVVCALIMLPLTSVLWSHLPQLEYVQFPWRWLLALNVAFSLAAAIAVRNAWVRPAVCILALLPVLICAHKVLAPWWDATPDLREMVDNQHDRIGNEGVDEYAPAGVDSEDVDQNAPLAKYNATGSAKIAVQRWDAEHRTVLADAGVAGTLVLRLFNYPLWQVKVNGRITPAETGEHGEMSIPLAAGENGVEVTFVEGWDRIVGVLISGLTLVTLLGWHIHTKKAFAGSLRAES